MIVDGEMVLMLCIELGVDNLVSFIFSSSFILYFFVVMDDSNCIFGIFIDGMVDFIDVEFGVCRVWGVVYVGDFLGEIGDDLLVINLVMVCFELLFFFVEVICLFFEGGSLSFVDGIENFILCSIENFLGMFEFISMYSIVIDFVFVIVGEDGVVYDIMIINMIDLVVILSGFYCIFGLVYIGNLSIVLGDIFDLDVVLSDECFDFFDN